MHFYIFYVIYLTISFSNGLLFQYPPFNENGELKRENKTKLVEFFCDNLISDWVKRMSLETFKELFKKFHCLHHWDDAKILSLYYENNTRMDVNKFVAQTTKCISFIETQYKSRYDSFLNHEGKMNLNELKRALVVDEIGLTQTAVNGLIPIYRLTDTRDMSFIDFRNLFVEVICNQIKSNDIIYNFLNSIYISFYF
ncbi:uncharacterized protein LOC126901300 [Daktulosphaira vitifoliae]|uniref:uncharacterized protein LOC126901300 n=1 Tax=Daktulosphaira vitifoliae TaxID=58002 RepID=UPI0021AA2520|nr:uncharacterized protein LOC126901300 [Daktulosphaira vitifoliae]